MTERPAAEEPWLFERYGWDWRWLSWGEAAARVEALAKAANGARGGGFDWRPSVAAVTGYLALASQADGRVEFGAPDFLWPQGVEGEAPAFHGGSALGDPGLLRQALSGNSVWKQAEELASRLGAGPERDVAVLGAGLNEARGPLWVAWSLVAGAALVLEGQADAYVPTALWARPTVLALGDAELTTLGRDLPRLRKGRRSPFGRLRALLVDEPICPAAEPWRVQGVELVAWPL